MKIIAFAAVAVSLLASAAGAEAKPAPRAHGGARESSTPPRAAVAIGRDGEDTSPRCSNENPNIEYRDCVNASTRDPNAKIRLG